MKFKIIGDGTEKGTTLVSEFNVPISGVRHLYFTLDPSKNNLAEIDFSADTDQLEFDISHKKIYLPQGVQGKISNQNRIIKLKIVGDGTASQTKILDSEADIEFEGITEISWSRSYVSFRAIDVLIELKSLKSANPHVWSPSQSAPAYGGFVTSGPYSYTPQPTQNPTPDVDGQIVMDFDSPLSCQHEWVNASFTGLKMVCKHCNADKQ